MSIYFNKRTYQNAQDLEEKVKEYFQLCIDKDVPANPAGLQLHLGILKQTITNWKTRPECSDLAEVMERAYQFMESEAWIDLKHGKGEFGKFYLSRVAKYSEMQKIESKTEHSGAIDITQKIQTALKQANE